MKITNLARAETKTSSPRPPATPFGFHRLPSSRIASVLAPPSRSWSTASAHQFKLRTGFRYVKTSCVVHDQPKASSSAGARPLKRRRSEDQHVEFWPPLKAHHQELKRRLEEAAERDQC
ncbi:hypothetical protein pipiens_002196 [Culex pipiens pipiens]|uniref:Uncharacterized protein n=1 Tax=Culex pipiens pipiens TaxID=38569 RepID=A0ABD1DIK0_CULPP